MSLIGNIIGSIFSLLLVIIFLWLYRKIVKLYLIEKRKAGQSENSKRKFRALNISIYLVVLLFFISVVLCQIIIEISYDKFLNKASEKDEHSTDRWEENVTQFQGISNTSDFITCLLLIYTAH